MAQPQTDVLIVGGGVSGLVTAWLLKQRGINVTLLDQNPETVGGWIQSKVTKAVGDQQAYLLEAGPNSFPTSAEKVLQLCLQLGLPLEPASPEAMNQRYVAIGSRLLLLPHSPVSGLFSSVLTVKEKWQLASKVLGLSSLKQGAEERETTDESVAQWVSRCLGEAVHRRLAQPFLTGVYAGNTHQLSARALFPKLVALAQLGEGSLLRGALKQGKPSLQAKAKKRLKPKRAYSLYNVRGGLQQLMLALHKRLGQAVWLGQQAVELTWQPATSTWQLTTQTNDIFVAKQVVLATPAFVSATLLAFVCGEASQALKAIDYAGIAVVYQAFKRTDVTKPKAGFGVLKCQEQPNPYCDAWLGTLWTSSVFPDRCPNDEVLVSHFFGGAAHPETLLWGDERLGQEALLQSGWQLGLSPAVKPTFQKVFNHAKAIPQYTLGHSQRIEQAQMALTGLAGGTVQLVGNYLRGISLNHCVEQAETVANHLIDKFL
jgi:protoporphyrinogen/coproporphyrinogen III oxidase